jgi:riboflavin transporter FmnP
MGSTVIRIMAAVTMGVVIMGAVDFMVTKGSVVECGAVMNSTAGTASMVEAAIAFTVEARSAAVAAVSAVVAAQDMEADTGKRGFFA